MNTVKRLAGRVALITGASRGIGAAVAKAYAAEGAHVILLARTQGALEALDDEISAAGGTATLLPFDLAETKKITGIAPVIIERFRRLDILVGNAAMLGNLSPVAMSDHKVFEETFKVNFFANYHLIRALDPLLRGSDAGRAIFVTSGAAQMHSPFWSGYAASKAALENMVATYAAETAYSPLKVNIIDPGAVATEMRRDAFPGEDASRLPAPASVTARFVELALPGHAATGQIVRAA
ncbi:MAG TPA: SDR family NAD(P)-dependent oxidoreductase [Patescibacteria group bacterium]|nr:SDR family NAD(P)-dependent oxidoreductase [Patescibacteria group bacterium]